MNIKERFIMSLMQIQAKEQVGSILANKILMGLIKDKYYQIDNDTSIRLIGDISFKFKWDDCLVIELLGDLPQVSAKKGFLFHITIKDRVSALRIYPTKMVVCLNSTPSQFWPEIELI